ncbi:MAG: hypothetical protein M1820_002149 [Bogoriella megaspora]|nr:MAG: hypothetical protein M1820_002149 [Bogoriella megaspora]
MFSRELGLGATFALATSALLIPSTSIDIDEGAEAKAMALAGVSPQVMPDYAFVKLDCASCVLEDSKQEDGSGENALFLNFTTSGDSLLLNDISIYPQSINFQPLRVPLVDASTNLNAIAMNQAKKPDMSKSRAASSYGVSSASSSTDEDGHKTTTLKVNLYALDQSPISVDEVTVNLIDIFPSHILHLQSVKLSPSNKHPMDPNVGNPTEGDVNGECHLSPMLCRWRAILAHRLSGFKTGFPFRKGGCHGRKPQVEELKGADNQDEGTHLPTHIKGIPPHRGGQERPQHHPGHHRHHHKLHMFLHAFVRAFVGVLIPVLVGIIAGMAASIIGMAVGQLVALIYVKVRGRRQGVVYEALPEAARSSMDSEVLPAYEPEEKIVGEAPPEYKDLPDTPVEDRKDGQ